ncbi:SMC domain protein [Fibrisoma limi BUZ 3]|uniref:SMC domain protein n=1 Tax=Fibrisoma limi BUZ 3 TaxID=1185876 RepID=I2GNU5_9BACT|nr:AAA family ATPase [Fibrisoma limi]CCH55573.1 SMC domain protein [Fibrisoma limi BUZ 3]
MWIKKLQIAGLRCIKRAEFTFQPGMNLLVGINGMGKTTVLDALRVCLSKVLSEIENMPNQRVTLTPDDINLGFKATLLFCELEIYGRQFSYSFQRSPRYVNKSNESDLKNRISVVQYKDDLYPSLKEANFSADKKIPLAIYFSTRRAVIFERELTIAGRSVLSGRAAAYDRALAEKRESRLQPIAEWFKAQEALGQESPKALKHIEVIRSVVKQFLPEFGELQVAGNDRTPFFRITKDGASLRIPKLSDGQRGVLALVLDLARRLSQANPDLEDPVKEGEAVVLIDELDLHLHPKWQRSIVENLTRTFPNCQFIATTHSPQIIPAVEPEQVQLIKDNEIIRPDRTLGMDTNWILRNLMETDERPEGAAEAIRQVEDLITEGDYEIAREAMVNFRQDKGFDLPEWAMLEARIARLEMFDEE